MTRVLYLAVTAALLSACNATPPLTAMQLPIGTPQARAQSDAGVRGAIRSNIEMTFEGLDTSKDKLLSDVEAHLPPADFAKADADKDKKLSLKEYFLATNAFSQSAFQQLKLSAYQQFSKFDTNHDGFVLVDEYMANNPQDTSSPTRLMVYQLFFIADRDHDRKLTLSEYEDVAVWNFLTFTSVVPYQPSAGSAVPPSSNPPPSASPSV